jgi:hypothetical protein
MTHDQVGSPFAHSPLFPSLPFPFLPCPAQAIDHMAASLMRFHNMPGRHAVVFTTYQAYLRDTHSRLVEDLARAQRDGYVLGAKLVRGAGGCTVWLERGQSTSGMLRHACYLLFHKVHLTLL